MISPVAPEVVRVLPAIVGLPPLAGTRMPPDWRVRGPVRPRLAVAVNRRELVVAAPMVVLLATSVFTPAPKEALPALRMTMLLPLLVAQPAPPLAVAQPPRMPLVSPAVVVTAAPESAQTS